MKKALLVTGLSGFVGSNLKSYFEQKGYSVEGVSRGSKGCNYSDLTPRLISEYEAFIHLAGKAHDTKKTLNEHSVKASADFVDEILTENSDPKPLTPYGKSKLLAENYIKEHQNLGKKRVYILRPCMIHGPNNKGNLNILYKFVSKGFPYPLGKYKNRRSYLSVSNLRFILYELITNPIISSGVYNLADDGTLSTNQLIRLISTKLGKKAKALAFPFWLVTVIARVGDVLRLPLNTERLEKLTENYVVSNQKIKMGIGKELPLTVNEGIIQTIKSFR